MEKDRCCVGLAPSQVLANDDDDDDDLYCSVLDDTNSSNNYNYKYNQLKLTSILG